MHSSISARIPQYVSGPLRGTLYMPPSSRCLLGIRNRVLGFAQARSALGDVLGEQSDEGFSDSDRSHHLLRSCAGAVELSQGGVHSIHEKQDHQAGKSGVTRIPKGRVGLSPCKCSDLPLSQQERHILHTVICERHALSRHTRGVDKVDAALPYFLAILGIEILQDVVDDVSLLRTAQPCRLVSSYTPEVSRPAPQRSRRPKAG